MKALNIGLSSIVLTSLAFAVACADGERGLKAKKTTPEDAHKYAAIMEKNKPGSTAGLKLAPLPVEGQKGIPGATGATGGTGAGSPPRNGVTPPPPPAPTTGADRTDKNNFVTSVGAGGDRRAAPEAGAGKSVQEGKQISAAEKKAVEEATLKINEIELAAQRTDVPVDRVFKGLSTYIKVEGTGENSRFNLTVESLNEIVSGSGAEKQAVTLMVVSKANLLLTSQLAEKRIVPLEINAKDLKTLRAGPLSSKAEFFAACVASSAEKKDCTKVTLLLLISASKENQYAVINTYEVDASAQNGLMKYVEGNQPKSFEIAKKEYEDALRNAAPNARQEEIKADAKSEEKKSEAPAANSKVAPEAKKAAAGKTEPAPKAKAAPAPAQAAAAPAAAPVAAPPTVSNPFVRVQESIQGWAQGAPGKTPAPTSVEEEQKRVSGKTPKFLTVDLEANNFVQRLKYQKCIKDQDCAEFEKTGEITQSVPNLPGENGKYRVTIDINASYAKRTEASNCVKFYANMYCGSNRLFRDAIKQ